MTDVFLVGILVLPLLLMAVLRINAPLVFLSVCLGNVLIKFVGNGAAEFFNLFLPRTMTSTQTVSLMLVLIPVVLTMIFMIRSVKGNRWLTNLLPGAAASFLLLYTLMPLLPAGVADSIHASPFWSPIDQAQELIIGVGSLICLFFLWLQRPKNHEHGKKHK
jgi:hypothetical protein